ncbi:MAG: VOC family protein [Anaerolineales bacterium]|jgi:catechol 2,3-dioxygenase-like lactoylglutathione lyase family enzyme
MISGLFHSGITISDLNRSLAFYGETLGIEHIRSQVSDQAYLAGVTGFPGCSLKIGFAQVEGDTSVLEIIEYVHPKGGLAGVEFGRVGTPHLGWAVDNLSAAYQRLSAQGVKFLARPARIGEGPWRGGLGTFLLDPDGLLLELIEPPGLVGGSGRLAKMVHTGFAVSRLKEALAFLSEKIGLEVIDRAEGESDYARHMGNLGDAFLQAAWLAIPGTDYRMELWEFRSPKGPPADMATNNVGSGHFCFKVEDMLSVYRTLAGQGVQFVGPPTEVTAGVNKGGYAIYFLGPDNIRFELFQGRPTRVA